MVVTGLKTITSCLSSGSRRLCHLNRWVTFVPRPFYLVNPPLAPCSRTPRVSPERTLIRNTYQLESICTSICPLGESLGHATTHVFMYSFVLSTPSRSVTYAATNYGTRSVHLITGRRYYRLRDAAICNTVSINWNGVINLWRIRIAVG